MQLHASNCVVLFVIFSYNYKNDVGLPIVKIQFETGKSLMYKTA
jgi:hypothetical protein